MQLAKLGKLMGGAGRGGGAGPVASQWWAQGALFDLDQENGRYYYNGAEQTVMPTSIDVTGLLDNGYSVYCDATSQATTNATNAYIISVDDGNDGVAADELIWNGRTSGGSAGRHSVTKATVSQASISRPASWANATRKQTAGSYKSGALSGVEPGVAITPINGGMPGPLITAFIGNSRAGDRPWGGTIHRLVVFPEAYSAARLYSLVRGKFKAVENAYSWWCPPAPINRNGWVYFTGQRGSALEQTAYRTKNGVVQKKVCYTGHAQDDHDTISHGFTAAGKYYVLYSGHNDDDKLRFRISTDDDPRNLGSEVIVGTVPSGTASYAQIYCMGTFFFALTQNTDAHWRVYVSTDLTGASWTEVQGIFTGGDAPTTNQWYITGTQLSDSLIRFFGMSHASNAQNPIFTMDLAANGDVSSGGSLLGNVINGGATPATHLNTEIVRTPASGRGQRILDVSDDCTKILIADFVSSDYSDCRYLLGTKGTPWTFQEFEASGGAGVWTSYFGGANFDRSTPAELALFQIAESAGTMTLTRKASTNGGASWTTTETLDQSAITKMLRPMSPKNADANCRVIYEAGSYTTYNSNDLWTFYG